MDLDDIIISCIFHYIEGFCPSDDSSESFRTFLNEIEWQLPKVVFHWTARCVFLLTTVLPIQILTVCLVSVSLLCTAVPHRLPAS